MSDKAWALEKMLKYGMKVDFSRGVIEQGSFPSNYKIECWSINPDYTFYDALAKMVKRIEG